MTVEQLHEILDDESKKMTVDILEKVIYELKNDCMNASYNASSEHEKQYYYGEVNAFYICLDLLQHLK